MIINIDGVSLHYEIFGQGRPLLLLHGWGGCVNAMAPIWQFFQKEFCVYVIDFPGQNNASSDPPKPWGIPEYAALVQHFMEAMNLHQVDVIAHSFGGRVAIFLAAKQEELFHKIVLADAAGIKPHTTLKRKAKRSMFRMGKVFLKLTSSPEMYEKKLASYRKKFASPDYLALQTDVMRQTFSKVISLDVTPYLKEIKQPTLLMWGENDVDTPLYMAKKMEKNIKDAGLVVLENAGHFSYLDATEKFNQVVHHFLTHD